MKYVDGLNYLDQLRDYVQDSLSIRQKFDKAEQSENFHPIEDPLSVRVKVEETKNNDNFEEFYLFDSVKEEIFDEGKIIIFNYPCVISMLKCWSVCNCVFL